jgi:hypothetical protein
LPRLDNNQKGGNILMRSPIISFLLLLGLMMPLSACDFGGGEAEEGSENTEQKKEEDDDDDD